MHLLSSCVCALLTAALLGRVTGLETVTGLYGKTLTIPCSHETKTAEEIMLTKWKYDKGEAQPGDLLVKKNEKVVILATDEYKDRVTVDANFSLVLSAAKLTDQRTFTCMLVVGSDIREYPVNVLIYKPPAGVEISDKAEALEIGKLNKLGKCVARDSNPAANVTWLKNNKALVTGGKGISIKNSILVDPVTGLSTTESTLEYSAEKADKDASFSCKTQHFFGEAKTSSPMTFTIIYSTENINLQVTPKDPFEGDNVTLTCVADGNPPPTSFNFHLKGKVEKVENSKTRTIFNVSRNATGEYKCSLTDHPSMEMSTNITVNYLDVNLSPSGKIVKRAGKGLNVTLQIDSSAKSTVSWTKDHVKLVEEPKFTELTYSDSGAYECEVKMRTVSRKASFDLVVEGAPVIRYLRQSGEKGQQKVLICEAEGSPKPAVTWSINGTLLNETSLPHGKIVHKIAVTPAANLSVICTVSNVFGIDTKVINVSSVFEEVRMDKRDQSENSDKTQLVVGVVVGLLIAAVVIGAAYWVYLKKSKQGSWKTSEKENGSSEEEKKLEEKEDNSQKAEV